MNEVKPVKMKIFPIRDRLGNIVRSRNCCGSCGAVVPNGVTHCPACSVPIFGRIGEGSSTKCSSCGSYIPAEKTMERCPYCNESLA